MPGTTPLMRKTPMTEIDADGLRRKYAQERAKRLRPEGIDQYVQPKGRLAHLRRDPYAEVVERGAKSDHVTFTCVGGTWYWNRYPGAQCDTASMIYLPLLEETGYMPSERYAHAPEIIEHCNRIATHYGLHEGALFHTEVTDLEWDADRCRWIVRTDRGDEFTSRFVALGMGPLHVAKLPGISGIETFEGHAFHTSRWDYAYTGGSPD